MKVFMAHLLALNVLLFPKDLTIIFIYFRGKNLTFLLIPTCTDHHETDHI